MPLPDPLLFGHDETQRIVAVQPITDRGVGKGHVHIYRRSEDGLKVSVSEVPFYPFFFLADVRFLAGFDRSKFRFQELKGRLSLPESGRFPTAGMTTGMLLDT